MPHSYDLIVVLHSDAKAEYFATPQAYETEKYARRDALAVARYARSFARNVVVLPADKRWVKKIIGLKPDVVVNLVDSVEGDDTKTPLVCATLEMLGIPFTGNGFAPVFECYDKYAVKQKLQKYALPTPAGFLAPLGADTVLVPKSFRYPVIVKLNAIHGSVGLSDGNIVHTEKELRRCINKLHGQFRADVLVEEYIEGTEMSAFIYEDGSVLRVLMSEDILKGGTDPYAIASYEFRWVEENPIIETKKFASRGIELIMRKAFAACGMKGYSKFDARIRDGIPYIIDVNPNPAFGPPENDSPFAKTAQMLHNIPFATLLQTIVSSALKRN